MLLGIQQCPSLKEGTRARASLLMPAPDGLTRCGGAGCTKCFAGDLCCEGKSPDSYKVTGGYGCAPGNSSARGHAHYSSHELAYKVRIGLQPR